MYYCIESFIVNTMDFDFDKKNAGVKEYWIE